MTVSSGIRSHRPASDRGPLRAAATIFSVLPGISPTKIKLGHDDPEIGNRINHRVHPSTCRPWPPFQPNSVKRTGRQAPFQFQRTVTPDWVSRKYVFIAAPISAGERTILAPAASSAANLSAAVPLPPMMMAPA